MIRQIKKRISLSISSFFMCSLLGCATADFGWGNRFYSGNPLPNNEIALIFAVNACSIHDIREETEKEEKVFGFKMVGWGPWDMLDLLPGRYIAGVIYSTTSHGYAYGKGHTTGITMGARTLVSLDARPGNIYVVYPEIIKTSDRIDWRPILANINDYSKEECQRKFRSPGSCHEKDIIMELAGKYLQSERRMMSYHPFEKPVMNIWTRRDYNGVWR